MFHPSIILSMLKQANPDVMKMFKNVGPFKIKPSDVPQKFMNNMGSIEFRKGIMKLDNEFYWGEWIVDTDLRHGRGILVTKNGWLYEGFWDKNKRSDQGRLITPEFIYSGGWIDDIATGSGILLDVSTKTIIKGEFEDMKPHGQCVKKFDSGTVFKGNFDHGIMTGKGKFICPDGSCYEGDFKASLQDGVGKFTDSKNNQYEGEFKNNKYHGKGTLKMANGFVYKGQFVNGKREGKGILHWPDGRFYDGDWLNDKQDGVGIFKDKQGRERKGRFIAGEKKVWLD